mgnify:CR=1 FL=1
MRFFPIVFLTNRTDTTKHGEIIRIYVYSLLLYVIFHKKPLE